MIYVIVPLVATLIAQVSKFFVKSNRLKLSWRNLIAYSGMPSGHAAMTVSLSTVVFLETGWSAILGVSLILTILTVRDAIGLRRYIGKQGQVINELVEDLDEDELLDEKYPHLAERLGHTKKQALAGAIIGLAVGWIGFLLF